MVPAAVKAELRHILLNHSVYIWVSIYTFRKRIRGMHWLPGQGETQPHPSALTPQRSTETLVINEMSEGMDLRAAHFCAPDN